MLEWVTIMILALLAGPWTGGCMLLITLLFARRGEGFQQRMHPSIFVSIPSYRDGECSKTLESLFTKADLPQRVYVGLCQQNKEDAEDCACLLHASQIRTITLSHTAARGPTYARYLVSTLYRGEDFFLAIDSHTRFAQGWDTKLIAMLEAKPGKALLSHYPPAHEHSMQQQVPTLCKSKWNDTGLPTFESQYTVADGRRVPFVAGGMMFAPGLLLTEVPFDPNLHDLFQGEEILYSARLYTSGWDVYTPTQNLLTHHYERPNAPKYWQDRPDYVIQQKASIQRARALLGLAGTPLQDNMPMGNLRTLQQFWEFAGLDPITQKSVSEQLFCQS